MKNTIKSILTATVFATVLASCTSKPAESTASETQDSVATETPAVEDTTETDTTTAQ